MKNKYVVAYITPFDINIKQEIIEANSKFEAIKEYLQVEVENVHELDYFLESQNSFATAIQINNLTKVIGAEPGALYVN